MTITPLWLTGFEHGLASANGTGLFDAITGAATIDTTSPRNGSYRGLTTGVASQAHCFQKNIAGTPNKIVIRCGFKVIALPSGVVNILNVQSTGAGNVNVRIDGSGVVQFAGAILGPTVTADGAWHLLEVQVDMTANPWQTYAKVDGAAAFGPASTAVAADTLAKLFIGQYTTNQAFAATIAWDDVIVGSCTTTGGANGEWIGDGKVLAQLAGSDGTHVTVADFSFGDAGAALSGTVTTASTMVDDAAASGGWTTTRSTTDNLAMRITNTGAYLEVAPATTAETGSANAVQALMSYSSSTTSSNAAACDVRNSAAAVTALNGTTGGTLAGFNVTANNFKSALVTKPVAGWTASEVNAVRWRFGGGTSSDISPVPTVQALMLEVDWPIISVPALAPTASPVSAATAPLRATTLFAPSAASAAAASLPLTAATSFTASGQSASAASAPIALPVALAPSAQSAAAASLPATAASLITASAASAASAIAELSQAFLAPAAASAASASAQLTAASAIEPTAASVASADAPLSAPSLLAPTAGASAAASLPLTDASLIELSAAGAASTQAELSQAFLAPAAASAASADAPATAASIIAPTSESAASASAPASAAASLNASADSDGAAENALSAASLIAASAESAASAQAELSQAFLAATSSGNSQADALLAAGSDPDLVPFAGSASSATVALSASVTFTASAQASAQALSQTSIAVFLAADVFADSTALLPASASALMVPAADSAQGCSAELFRAFLTPSADASAAATVSVHIPGGDVDLPVSLSLKAEQASASTQAHPVSLELDARLAAAAMRATHPAATMSATISDISLQAQTPAAALKARTATASMKLEDPELWIDG